MATAENNQNSTPATNSLLMMMELQVDELQSMLVASEEHRKAACNRASSAEKRNRKLKEQINSLEEDMRIIAQCWQCANLGNRNFCSQCSNYAVFEKISRKEEPQ